MEDVEVADLRSDPTLQPPLVFSKALDHHLPMEDDVSLCDTVD